MGFSAKQVQALRRSLNSRHVRTREANGRELSYIEGWYAISEANRIFGFDGWNRETAGVPLRARSGKPRIIPCRLYRQGAHHRACGWRNHCPRRPWVGRRSRHLARRSPRHRSQGGGNRCHQTGAGDFRQTVRTRALSEGQEYRLARLANAQAGDRKSDRPSRASVYTPTIRHRSRGRRITTVGGTRAR